jgi:hypothetical protein
MAIISSGVAKWQWRSEKSQAIMAQSWPLMANHQRQWRAKKAPAYVNLKQLASNISMAKNGGVLK